MNLVDTEKDKFSLKWWDLLKHHFSQPYMQQIYLKIMSDAQKGYKILPKSDVIYNRFKLINPEDVRVVFLTKEPIGSYQQSLEWRNVQSQIEKECFDGLYLNLEDSLEYMIPQGIIHLSPSLTVCNKSDHSNIGWSKFVIDVINKLNQTDNKILFVGKLEFFEDELLKDGLDLIDLSNVILLEEGCFTKINQFMKTEYNETIKW